MKENRTGRPRRSSYVRLPPIEFKVVALRECPVPFERLHCTKAADAAAYWQAHIATHPYFNPECECLVVLLLNAKREIKGHQLLSIGTQDSVLWHPREVFRGAIAAAANAVILMHNHPSGDPSPSGEDLFATRELVRAGKLLRIRVLDHVIVGENRHVSLEEQGFC